MEGSIDAAPTELIAWLWEEHWGLPIVTAKREYMPPHVEGLVCVPTACLTCVQS